MTTPDSTYPAKTWYRGDVARHYLANRTRSRKWRREQQLMADIVGRIASGSSVLDIPLGTGRFLPFYAGMNHVVYGLDISTDMLAEARRLTTGTNVTRFIQADAEALPLPDASVDYVVCMRLLNFTPLPVLSRIVTEFTRVARKGIVIEVRVAQHLGFSGLAMNTVADPLTNINRLLSRCYAGAKTLLGGAGPAPSAHGDVQYLLHRADEVDRILAAQALVVDRVIEIDRGVDFRHGVVTPLRLFCCSKPAAV